MVCAMPGSDACIAGSGATDGLPIEDDICPSSRMAKSRKVSGNLEGGEWDNYFAKWVMPGTSSIQAKRAEEFAKTQRPLGAGEAGAIQAKLCKDAGRA